jgi:hypothetical protein
VISICSQPDSGVSWWVEHFAAPASFIVLGALIGFFLGRINQRLDARKSKKNFLRAIALELRGLQGNLKQTKSTIDETLLEYASGKCEMVKFTDSYGLAIFTTLLGKLVDISEEEILTAIVIYSEIQDINELKDKLSEEGTEIVRLDPGPNRETRIEYYFTGLKHLSDIISMVTAKIDKLLPKLEG